MIARVEGRVEFRLGVNAETGAIEKVDAISGHPMLQFNAAEAVRKWRLVPGTFSGDTVSAIIDYSLTCP